MVDNAEFDLIKKYFTPENWRTDVDLGVGDDCALLTPPSSCQLATTVDTLVEGVHFPAATSPEHIAYKSLAVSLSDLASMGAEPAWATLALTLPTIDDDWLCEFSDSFNQTLNEFSMQLIGGDTTQGPLSITVQATGFIRQGHVMRRDKAMAGDLVYVTGHLGDAALALKLLEENDSVDPSVFEHCMEKLNRPVPVVRFAQAAAELCTCAIDVSDGLIADLNHILESSQCGAEINIGQIPVSTELRKYFTSDIYNKENIDWSMVLSGGDDYELCMTLPDSKARSLEKLAGTMGVQLTCIGTINSSMELKIVDEQGQQYTVEKLGYEHFSNND